MGATPSKKRRHLRRRQEKSLQFQLTNLEKAILDSEDNEALVWLSRILIMSSVDTIELCQRVAKVLVRIAAENISSEDTKALKLAAAVWVTVRETEPHKHLQLSNQETLALVTIYLSRATKGHLVRDAMMEAHASVQADDCVCCGARGGGVGAAEARGRLFPVKKLCHAVNNVRKFLLRSDLENSLYWLSCTVLHIRRQTRPYSWRRRMMAMNLTASFRGFAKDFVYAPFVEEILDSAFSLFDFNPEKYEPAGDLRDIECVLALVVVKLVNAPKIEYVKETFKEILAAKRRMEATASYIGSDRLSLHSRSISHVNHVPKSRTVSINRFKLKTNSKTNSINKKGSKTRKTNQLTGNGEDLSLFKFSTVRNWLDRNQAIEKAASRLNPEDAAAAEIVISNSGSFAFDEHDEDKKRKNNAE